VGENQPQTAVRITVNEYQQTNDVFDNHVVGVMSCTVYILYRCCVNTFTKFDGLESKLVRIIGGGIEDNHPPLFNEKAVNIINAYYIYIGS